VRQTDAAGNMGSEGNLVHPDFSQRLQGMAGNLNDSEPQITALADGGYVVAWIAETSDGQSTDIFTQRYDSANIPVGTTQRLQGMAGDMFDLRPQITALADGGYVVTWFAETSDGQSTDTFTQRFNAAGEMVPSLVVDTIAPGVTVNIVDASLNGADNSSAVTFIFTEAPIAFDASDIAAVGGVISGLTKVNATTYTATLTANVGYEGAGSVTVNATYADVAGNPGTSGSDTVMIDTVAPPVPLIDSIADNDQVDVSESSSGFNITGTGEIGATVTLTFSSGITLAGGNTAVVDGSGNWSVALIEADVILMAQGAEAVTAFQTDLSGYSSGNSVRPFTVDTIAPVLLSTTPVDNDSTASPGGDLQLVFSENVFVGSGDIRIVNDTSSTTITIAIDSPLVTIVGNVVTVNPASDLSQASQYHIEIDAGALVDGAGNAYAGISNDQDWNFGIGDPSIDFSAIALDNIVNAAENAADIIVSGHIYSSSLDMLAAFIPSDITVSLVPRSGVIPLDVTVNS
jgi:hypothetical protein